MSTHAKTKTDLINTMLDNLSLNEWHKIKVIYRNKSYTRPVFVRSFQERVSFDKEEGTLVFLQIAGNEKDNGKKFKSRYDRNYCQVKVYSRIEEAMRAFNDKEEEKEARTTV